MTAADPTAESFVDRRAILFRVPVSTMPAKLQVEEILAERDHWCRWLEAQAERGGDITAIYQLARNSDQARRTIRGRRLSPVASLAAQEVSRRADRELHRAVHVARKRGALLRTGQSRIARRPGSPKMLEEYGVSSTVLGATSWLWRDVDDELFEKALEHARDEGNLSREQLRSSLGSLGPSAPQTLRLQRLREMAGEGATSSQIAADLALSPVYVERLAEWNGIAIPGNAVILRGQRSVDPQRIVDRTIDVLDGVRSGLELLDRTDYAQFSPAQRQAWLDTLTPAMRLLRTLHKELTNAH